MRAAGIETPSDLIRTYPRSYRDRRTPTPIAEIARRATQRTRAQDEAESAEEIAVGRILQVDAFRARTPLVAATIDDGTGTLRATWFGRRSLALEPGTRIFVHGRVTARNGRGVRTTELNVLDHRLLAEDETYVGDVVPIYPASKDLPSRILATAIARNREALLALVRMPVPDALARVHGYPGARESWHAIHAPESPRAAARARERLIYDEFFMLALGAAQRRMQRRSSHDALALAGGETILGRFEAALPFALTDAQRRVVREIFADLGQDAPMNRLVQGDVGSGKTVVAAAAVVLAAAAGVQTALMAPTEILAMQHARKLAPLLLPFGVRTEALTGSLSGRSSESVRGRIESGEADLVVGTHALIEDRVVFKRLGLAIVDEQHRFGVGHRARLRAKAGSEPHTLAMTATPIPRTLAQVKHADLDVSTIDELPPGRTPIGTYALRESRKSRAYELVRKMVARGRQAYVVVPAIEGSDIPTMPMLANVVAEFEHLRRDVFPEARVGLIHGKLPAREKDGAMEAFARGELDVLLATTVIEVGVDVPNAVVMIVLDAHRFGLAQLHQLRGRVGRGAAESYCVLVAPDDRLHAARLEVLCASTDGFVIAEADLALRGSGELSGTAQTGAGGELLGDLVADVGIYVRAKGDAEALLASDPVLGQAEHLELRAHLDERAGARASLMTS